jgi:putative PEP-CTERM system histidine kinase
MLASAVVSAACAVAYTLLCALILLRTKRSRTGWALALACLVTASWAAATAIMPGRPLGGLVGGLELFRAVAWYGFLLHLYRRSVPRTSQLGDAFVTMGMVAVIALSVTPLADILADRRYASLSSIAVGARLGLAVCSILLIENLYRNAPEDVRWHVNLPCIVIGALFVYDIVLYSDAILFRRISPSLLVGRAVGTTMVAPLLAVAAARNRRWGIDIHVSRTVVFHSATLVVSGLFLLGLAMAGEVFRKFGADWGTVAELSLIFGGLVAIAVLLASRSARSRLRALLVDHFFSHRYDYRQEWIRCITTLSAADIYVPLHTRVIRAMAEALDSPGGVLFLRDTDGGPFRWAGSWNMPALTTAVWLDNPLPALFRDGSWIVELDRVPAIEWLDEELARLWLAVPLNHLGRLVGFILVARSRAGFKLDREVFALLRIIGREVAGFVAEQRATEALMQARELREYGQRFAFVAHDIKNVSSQLSLLLANAERHLSNPEFQRDMLNTVRASVQKISRLLTRLQAPESDAGRATCVPAERLDEIVAAYRRIHGTTILFEHDGRIASLGMPAGAFDAAVAHLLDNAIEASDRNGPVSIRLQQEGRRAAIDITDQGLGMTPEFVRDELFRPFGSSKRNGSGIGAFQARELVREVGGDLVVLSRPGRGTTMRLLLPLVGEPVEQVSSLPA